MLSYCIRIDRDMNGVLYLLERIRGVLKIAKQENAGMCDITNALLATRDDTNLVIDLLPLA